MIDALSRLSVDDQLRAVAVAVALMLALMWPAMGERSYRTDPR